MGESLVGQVGGAIPRLKRGEYFRTGDVAKVLDIKRSTVTYWVGAGKVPYRKMVGRTADCGSETVFFEEDVRVIQGMFQRGEIGQYAAVRRGQDTPERRRKDAEEAERKARSVSGAQLPDDGAWEKKRIDDGRKELPSAEELLDYEGFIEKYCEVKAKSGKWETWKLWSNQREYCELRRKARLENGQVRITRLKARQLGSSTIAAVCMGLDALANPGSRCGVIADQVSKAHHIARNYLWQNLVRLSQVFEFEVSDYRTTTEKPAFEIWPKDESKKVEVWVLTAGSGNKAGQSLTFQFMLASEVARWTKGGSKTDSTGHGDEVFNALLQSIPDPWEAPQAAIDVESTANGPGGAFHSLWNMAEKGEDGWVGMFTPWWKLEHYCVPGKFTTEEAYLRAVRNEKTNPSRRDDMIKKLGLNADDVAFVMAYPDLTWGQILWRQRTIATKFKGDVAAFREQYPSCASEAFIGSGQPVFDLAAVEVLVGEAKDYPPIPYALIPKGEHEYEFEPFLGLNPEFNVFKVRRRSERYVIGVDTSLGIGGLGGLDESKLVRQDYSVASVWNTEGEQVAEWAGKPDPEAFAEIVHALGKAYWNAALAIERNGHGITVLNRLADWNYRNIYIYMQRDARGTMSTPVLGIPNYKNNRDMMLSAFRAGVRQKIAKVRSAWCIDEMVSLQAENGRIDHRTRGHDDRVWAAVFAWWVLNDRNATFGGQEVEQRDVRQSVPRGVSVAFDPTRPLIEQYSQRSIDPYHPILNPWGEC